MWILNKNSITGTTSPIQKRILWQKIKKYTFYIIGLGLSVLTTDHEVAVSIPRISTILNVA